MTAEIIWFAREIREENRENAKRNAAYSAQLLEQDRVTFEISPTRREERRLYNAYMAAIREQVAATDRVNEAHNAWMKAAEKVGA